MLDGAPEEDVQELIQEVLTETPSLVTHVWVLRSDTIVASIPPSSPFPSLAAASIREAHSHPQAMYEPDARIDIDGVSYGRTTRADPHGLLVTSSEHDSTKGGGLVVSWVSPTVCVVALYDHAIVPSLPIVAIQALAEYLSSRDV